MIPGWILELPWNKIVEAADAQKVPYKLIGAIVMAESAGLPFATRFEPHWKYFHHVRSHAERLGVTPETEQVHQATSWGLMQVMGGVIRELGFMGHLPELTDETLNLKFGCLKIKQIAQRYSEKSDIIAAYNAGSVIKTPGRMYKNQSYVDKVSTYLRDLERL